MAAKMAESKAAGDSNVNLSNAKRPTEATQVEAAIMETDAMMEDGDGGLFKTPNTRSRIRRRGLSSDEETPTPRDSSLESDASGQTVITKKRKTTKEGPANEKDAVRIMGRINKRIQGFLTDPAAKFNKGAALQIGEYFMAATEVVAKLSLENSYLRGKLEDTLKSAEAAKATAPSYAGALSGVSAPRPKPRTPPVVTVGREATKKPKPTPRPTYSAIVSTKGDQNPKEGEVRKRLEGVINPMEWSLKIRKLRNTKSGKIIVETDTKEELDKILQNPKIQECGLTTELTTARKPRVMVFDVPRGSAEEGIVAAIFTQNKEIFGTRTLEEVKGGMRLVYKTGLRERTTENWVFECSPEIRNALRTRDRIYLGWERCRVVDHVSLSRCYKCLDFGHIAKHCGAEGTTCGHCGKDGHKKESCTDKDKPPTCGLCKRKGRPSAHGIEHKDCGSHKVALERYRNSIDYGR